MFNFHFLSRIATVFFFSSDWADRVMGHDSGCLPLAALEDVCKMFFPVFIIFVNINSKSGCFIVGLQVLPAVHQTVFGPDGGAAFRGGGEPDANTDRLRRQPLLGSVARPRARLIIFPLQLERF